LRTTNNSPKIPVSSADIREAFYKTSDGVYSLIGAIADDPATSGDKDLSAALDGLTVAFANVAAALRKYNWD
jgi:hypothetical protein